MKNKKYIIIAVVAVIIVAAAIMITQPLKWFEKSFEAVVQETLFLVFLECFLLPVYFLPGKILVFYVFFNIGKTELLLVCRETVQIYNADINLLL